MMSNALALTANTHQSLKTHLYAGDGLESAAILLCHCGTTSHGFKLSVKETIMIPAARCQKRTPLYLSWAFAEFMTPEKITEIDKAGLSIVTVHSHPGGFEDFSETDDKNDRGLFASVNAWFDDDRPNGAAIMLPDGKIIARTADADGNFTPIGTVSVTGNNITIWKQQPADDPAEYGTRVLQTFGKGTFNLLRAMQVGVVGCSGTGSIVAELLARNCIGGLVLVDSDVTEEKNLNRILNAYKKDAANNTPKVTMLKNAIAQMGMDVAVTTHQTDTYNKAAVEALAGCDVVFGCVDSAVGRYHLECIATAYLIPYFDVGVFLAANGNGGISHADASAHYRAPDGQSLLSRGVYTTEQVTAEDWKHNDPAYYKKQQIAGYLAAVGEEQPAVLSVNMMAACLSFNDFLARLHGFRLDDNADFSFQRFQFVQGCYLNGGTEKDTTPLFEKYLGMGDKSMLIRRLKKGD